MTSHQQAVNVSVSALTHPLISGTPHPSSSIDISRFPITISALGRPIQYHTTNLYAGLNVTDGLIVIYNLHLPPPRLLGPSIICKTSHV